MHFHCTSIIPPERNSVYLGSFNSDGHHQTTTSSLKDLRITTHGSQISKDPFQKISGNTSTQKSLTRYKRNMLNQNPDGRHPSTRSDNPSTINCRWSHLIHTTSNQLQPQYDTLSTIPQRKGKAENQTIQHDPWTKESCVRSMSRSNNGFQI